MRRLIVVFAVIAASASQVASGQAQRRPMPTLRVADGLVALTIGMSEAEVAQAATKANCIFVRPTEQNVGWIFRRNPDGTRSKDSDSTLFENGRLVTAHRVWSHDGSDVGLAVAFWWALKSLNNAAGCEIKTKVIDLPPKAGSPVEIRIINISCPQSGRGVELTESRDASGKGGVSVQEEIFEP
jgi:hypothetical protein